MAIIPQVSMFVWEKDLENLRDLERLRLILETLPDESLMLTLEKARGPGRDDYPVRAMWNLIMAMIVFGHPKVADVLRELNRNVQLRYMCGFGNGKLPGAANVSRFMAKLESHREEIKGMFYAVTGELRTLLPGFGEGLAIDSKWVHSMANRVSVRKNADRRSETEAAWGTKEYKGRRPDGSEWTRTERCFGFKLHALADAKYELPTDFIVSNAAGSDIVYGKKLLDEIKKDRPDTLKDCNYLMGDRGYDDTTFIKELKGLEIKAIIDKRDMWKAETEKEVPGYRGIYYNERGEVFCYSPERGDRHEMRPAGYDAERDALRVKCPAKMYGVTCREAGTCTHCKNIRVPLSVDERIFTQVARPSYKWQGLYRKRTSVERIFSRLDVSFGFEAKRLRGQKRMELLSGMAFLVMNTMALGRVREKKPELMRSLVKAA